MASRVRDRAGRYMGAWLVLTFLCALAPAVLAQPVEERPEVRVIIDVSGSMRANDPDRLRASALELLVSLLPEGTSAGVWTFGETVANPLPSGEVNAVWRRRAQALGPALAGVQPYTDIEAAVRRAAAPAADGWRHLVLLTDGVIDLPPARGSKPEVDAASRRELLDELAVELADSGVVVHAIAFSDQADMALVESLSRTTGGLPALVASPESLLVAFLDIVERIFPTDRVPLEGGRFHIEPGIETFSALLFHDPDAEPLMLLGPEGREYRADAPPQGWRWQVEPRFDLLRVPDPIPGEWRIEGEVTEQSRIGVTSALTLRTGELPATAFLGFPIPVEAWLERDGMPYTDELEGLSLRADLAAADGEVWATTRLAHDGERFRGELPAPTLPGGARLVITAEAEGMVRQRSQAINLLAPLEASHQPESRRVVLTARHPELAHHNTRPWAELAGERLEIEPRGERSWMVALPELDDSVSRPLKLGAEVRLQAQTHELRLPPLMLFAESATGLDLARGRGELSAERFHQDLAAGHGRDADPGGVVERFVGAINRGVASGVEHWRTSWQPRLSGLAARPLVWALAGGAVLIVILLFLLRGRRQRRRPAHREDPHV
ncbi:VWA domain-containing protein [Halomonas icarae]|uniref:VWA domain-containing protein n=1 Tax=Halomonas icarae TaxID=2691040 RepID=A0A7X5AJM0_9GAMM|nr:vWA domain-containing protein [Halomonas icarae]MDR5901155.1 VWA domain-containing protein [Halomonas icarae]NAW11432.1 VWA domain-containing protein [Halomonas icarae]